MPEPENLKMVCNNCSTVNEFVVQVKRFRAAGSCSNCRSVLFEIDEISNEYRITKNLRIYYRNLSDTIYDIHHLLIKKSEEIRKRANEENIPSADLWQEAVAGLLFHPDMVNMLATAISLLENENSVSDGETRSSINDFLTINLELLRNIERLNEAGKDFPETLVLVKDNCRNIQEFGKMMDKYLGELSTYERKTGK